MSQRQVQRQHQPNNQLRITRRPPLHQVQQLPVSLPQQSPAMAQQQEDQQLSQDQINRLLQLSRQMEATTTAEPATTVMGSAWQKSKAFLLTSRYWICVTAITAVGAYIIGVKKRKESSYW